MFCPACGNSVENGTKFCPHCGNALPAAAAPQQPQYQQPQYQQPQYQQPQYQQPQYQQPQYQQPVAPALGMKWYKFLIYFGLFAGALLNAASGASFLTGAAYGDEAELVYEYIEGLQGLDMLVGICLIAVAIVSFYTRFLLSGYRKNGPKMLNITYLAVAAVQLIYVIGTVIVCPSELTEYLDFTSTFTSIAVSMAMIAYNTKYFKERAHLFVND